MECLFCQIRDGQIPPTRVCEDAKTLAFMDISSVNDGHLLVIPKAHAISGQV
ncbi:MAG: HIT family protein [candidate division NC10 bacterium]|nr:HIT family protein [candidate division NC10 bacterium]